MPAKAGDTGNRLYFAEQIPQLAKSQAERLILPKEEGIQDKGSSQTDPTSQKSQPEATRKRETTHRKGDGTQRNRDRFYGHFPKIVFKAHSVFHCRSWTCTI
jgi:hypothetical protein